jgi:hypothetical protein
LFCKEKVVQTGPAAAALALNTVQANEVAKLRNGVNNTNPIECDIAFAGLQVVRLYMMAYDGNDRFKEARCTSGMRVNNALNGSFYKEPKDFTMETLKEDKVAVEKAMKSYRGLELEELAFSSGACGCMLRSRKEWEQTEVGKAVCSMPLYRLEKVTEAPVKSYGKSTKKGPLSGIKVLDLTHIIAGPACTRLLAEQGAEVSLIRRGKFEEQEQAMLELDGWAGKHLVELDFNIGEELELAKQMVREADVVICSYQYGALDRFGLSKEDIHKLNPNIIFGSMMCFSDSVWRSRPGWAPLAEDITGLSIRNGSPDKPKNLNGVPLDYIPGFLLACGIMEALKCSMTEGGSYDVTGSLTRAGYWLHECTDICEGNNTISTTTTVISGETREIWENILVPVKDTAVGTAKFPSPAVYQRSSANAADNMRFWD